MKGPPVPALLVTLLVALLSAACSSPGRMEIRTRVEIGPGGRAEGRMTLSPDGLPSLRLVNGGPGRVDHVVRTPSGRVLSGGPLERLFVVFDDPACAEGEAVIVLETFADAASAVGVNASAIGGTALKWDLSRANAPAAKP